MKLWVLHYFLTIARARVAVYRACEIIPGR